MVLTPVELESKEFSRAMRGYNSEEVDKFLKNVLKEYEALYRENKELKDAYSRAMQELEKYKNLENTITKTLVTAQKAAEDARKNAQKEAELIIREARLKGDELMAEAEEEIQKKRADYEDVVKKHQVAFTELKLFLLSHLQLLEKNEPDSSEEDSTGEEEEIMESSEEV